MRLSPTSLVAFAIALALGLAAALAYAWLLAPPQPAAVPAALNPGDRELYLRLVAAAYVADGDRARAAARLDAMGPSAMPQLTELLTADLRSGRSADELARLAADLGLDSPAIALALVPSPLPAATTAATLAPPATPTTSPIEVLSRDTLCSGRTLRHLEVSVVDLAGEPLPGMAITLRRTGGAATGDAVSIAYTGFAVDGGPGAADFELMAGARYALELDGQVVMDNLTPAVCPDGLEGGWRYALRVRAGN